MARGRVLAGAIGLLAVATLLFACAQWRREAVPKLPPVDRIVVEKARRVMTLHSGGRVVHRIRGIQLGDRPVGPKRFAGDERTPEGRYRIDFRNPESAYHLSLRISYPDARDEAFAKEAGRNPGGDIFIHGQPNWLRSGRLPGDWTDGCIAVSNAEMDMLWAAVTDGAEVEILP